MALLVRHAAPSTQHHSARHAPAHPRRPRRRPLTQAPAPAALAGGNRGCSAARIAGLRLGWLGACVASQCKMG
eukprot:366390-Chlamydomonas_euryale.AAC.37